MTRILDTIIQYGTLLFVFLIPWQARLILVPGSINGGYWEYGTRSLYATEALLFVILLAVVVKGAAYVMRRKPRFSMRRLASPAGVLIVFLAWAGASIFWSPDRSVALEHWLVLVEAVAVSLMLASGTLPARQLSWAVILSGSIQAVLGFVQFRTQEVIGSTWFGMAFQHASILGTSVVETDTLRLLRAYGSFPHPNLLGAWLVLGLLLAVKEAKRTPLAYIAIALLSAGLAVTFSRGAWLAFAVGVAVFVLSAIARRAHIKQAGLGLAVIVLFAGALAVSYPEPFKERLFGGGRLEAKSTEERASGISESWRLIKQHLVIGVGIGNYGLAVRRDIDASQPAYYYQPVHSVPLLVFAELGVIGILVIGYWLLVILRRVLNARSLVVVVPFVILILFDHYLWSLYSGLMIGVVYFANVSRK